jgi:hypothetical protein
MTNEEELDHTAEIVLEHHPLMRTTGDKATLIAAFLW